MLAKLALRNIRRSVRDYAIYFVTLLVAITVFYAFNSVSDQQVMKDIAASNKTNIIDFTDTLMSIFSTVVSLVLGFLVIYANQLLIRRRKREFGTYFLLGMKASQVSRVILYETVMVGVVSLILGLGLGVLVSQLLSFGTAAIYGIPMPDYQFTFSMRACMWTLVCFVAIYVVVAVFNVFSIGRCKLIDLINAESRNQKAPVRNPWVCLVLFIASVATLAVAYNELQINGMTFQTDEHFMLATVLMLVGTLVLFFSLSGFLIAVVTRIRGIYLRKLRPFTTRQVASKVNTSYASMWIVSVLLFFAITTFATGMAMVDAFVKDVGAANPYDASIISYQSMTQDDEDPRAMKIQGFDVRNTEEYLQEHFVGWDDAVKESKRIDVYNLPLATYGDIMDATGTEVATSGGYIGQQYVDVVGLTQFNDLLKMQGKQPVELGEGEYLVTNNMPAAEEVVREMAAQDFPLVTPSGTLLPQNEVYEVQLSNNSMLSNGCTIVLKDDVLQGLGVDDDRWLSYLNITFQSGIDAEMFNEGIYDSEVPGVSSVLSREYIVAQSKGMRLIITYLALYIGLVLLVTVAAVLAIQLLSLTIDSLRRYRMLSRLGCDMSMLGRSLFAQVLVYFLLPLVVGVCHSAWTINVMTKSIFDGFGLNLLPTILMSAGFVLVIYGGYLLITYLASRATVKQSL